jgi:hypothetical protein
MYVWASQALYSTNRYPFGFIKVSEVLLVGIITFLEDHIPFLRRVDTASAEHLSPSGVSVLWSDVEVAVSKVDRSSRAILTRADLRHLLSR